MAKLKFIFQGIRQFNDHETAIRKHLELRKLGQIIFVIAFARESGVMQIRDFLRRHNNRTIVYVGIRNGITSSQGLLALHKIKVRIYTFDTGSASILFHPKVYISFNDSKGRVIIGSANLTQSGLNDNIEASTVISIDRQDEQDEQFLNNLISSITSLQNRFPDHVVEIRRRSDILRLLRQGRIEDERISQPQLGTARIPGDRRDKLPRIKLFKKHREPSIKPINRRIIPFLNNGWILSWVSKGLTERDLNIPTGATTNPTGSMLLKKGKLKNIDQRKFFRKVVFNSLNWENDPKPSLSHLQRARAEFELIVKGVNLGRHLLKLTHNSRTDTRAYEQLNAMTQIHWGTTKDLIAHRDLLGRELRLYKRTNDPRLYLIEID